MGKETEGIVLRPEPAQLPALSLLGWVEGAFSSSENREGLCRGPPWWALRPWWKDVTSHAHSSGHKPSFIPSRAPIGGSQPEAEG